MAQLTFLKSLSYIRYCATKMKTTKTLSFHPSSTWFTYDSSICTLPWIRITCVYSPLFIVSSWKAGVVFLIFPISLVLCTQKALDNYLLDWNPRVFLWITSLLFLWNKRHSEKTTLIAYSLEFDFGIWKLQLSLDLHLWHEMEPPREEGKCHTVHSTY